jgi:putative ABC transport system permease protein
MDRPLHELRHAFRRLRRTPGFTAAAIVTLALGIGANALIFSVVNALFLRPLAYRDPARLVWASEFFPKFNRSMMFAPDFAAWKRQNTAFERMEAMGTTFGANLISADRPAERVEAAHVTPGFFAMIGIAPRIGPGFDANAFPYDAPLAIISDSLWHSYFGADSAIAGKNIMLNGKPLTVVGVMPPGFLYPDGPDSALWLPDAVPPDMVMPRRGTTVVRMIGRLKPGITLEQARAELDRIAHSMDWQWPAPWSGYHASAKVRVASLQEQLTSDSRTAPLVLMGAVGFLLLIACANVANLFLARAIGRRKEIAMRLAIGALRRDIVRMLLAESLLLGAFGGALGGALLFWGRSAVQFLMPKALAQPIPVDWRVLAFIAASSLAAGLLFGLAPALSAARADVNSSLKETAIRSGGRLPALLSAAQIALSLVLLAGAGLMIRTFFVLASIHPGFDAHNVLTASAMLHPVMSPDPYEQNEVEFAGRLVAGIERLPGVRYAAVTSAPLMTQFNAVESGLRADDGPEIDQTVSESSVSPNYFQLLGIPLAAGRFFDARDVPGSTPAIIINRTLAHLLFQDRNPIGHKIDSKTTVVGVVADVHHRALDDKVWPETYLPFAQAPSPWITVLARTAGNPAALTAPIRAVAQSIDSSQPLFDIDLLEHSVALTLVDRRERALVLGAFAGLALLIAVVGIYGVMSYAVARRTHEIGLRMALGAERSDVLRLVVSSGLRMAAGGMAVGLAGALFATRVLKTFLYGVEPTDRVTIVAVCAILGAAAFLASYLPARRAAAVDPMAALRLD